MSLLNRDLSKTLIIDNSPEVFLRQPDNGLVIASWEGHSPMSREVCAKEFCAVEDFALINLFYWLECKLSLGFLFGINVFFILRQLLLFWVRLKAYTAVFDQLSFWLRL